MEKYQMILFILLIIIGLAGTDFFIIKNKYPKEPIEFGLNPKVFFCLLDNCTKQLQELIYKADKEIHCTFFDLNSKEIIKAIEEKTKDIEVKLVIDNNNKEKIKSNIIYDDSNQLTHNKFCIIDNKIVWTGSFNPTERGNNKNNNNAILIQSKYLALNYEAEFQELWNRNFGSGYKTKYPKIIFNNITILNYFCPEDRCGQKVIEEIRIANESLYFMTFSFTHENIADSILNLDKKIEIKGIFEKTQAGSKYSQYHRLKNYGTNVIVDSNPYNMHHKVFIIDNTTVITGSFNPSKNGDENNDENIIIIKDKKIAEAYLEEFFRIWDITT